MRLPLVLIALIASCGHPAPAAPSSPPQRNAAVDYAQTLLDGVACIPTRTGVAGKPDTAICDFDSVLARCKVGRGAGSKCMPFADLTPPPEQAPAPKPDEKPKAEEPPPAQKSKDPKK